MKALSSLLCLSLLLSSCSGETPSKSVVLDETFESSTGEVISLPEVDLEDGRESTVASSDMTLVDTTGYGFAYDANNVLDEDFSTSWCRGDVMEEDGPFAGGLTLTFSESPAGKTVGIVPGFARDETIYFQNNRVKQLVLQHSASPILEDNITFDFEDSYGMQFFTLPEDVGTSLTFYVGKVYPGSKYNDTCIAEMDLWSDFVETKDAAAAMNYYETNKADDSKRPVGISDFEMIFAYDYYDIATDDLTTACGAIDMTYIKKDVDGEVYTYTWKEDGDGLITSNMDNNEYLGGYHGGAWGAWAGMTPVISAKLNEWAKEGDELEVKWILTGTIQTLDEKKLMAVNTVKAKACSDGSLYISDSFEPSFGSYAVEVSYQGTLLERTAFTLAQ